jgi:hypothetical protein
MLGAVTWFHTSQSPGFLYISQEALSNHEQFDSPHGRRFPVEGIPMASGRRRRRSSGGASGRNDESLKRVRARDA